MYAEKKNWTLKRRRFRVAFLSNFPRWWFCFFICVLVVFAWTMYCWLVSRYNSHLSVKCGPSFFIRNFPCFFLSKFKWWKFKTLKLVPLWNFKKCIIIFFNNFFFWRVLMSEATTWHIWNSSKRFWNMWQLKKWCNILVWLELRA